MRKKPVTVTLIILSAAILVLLALPHLKDFSAAPATGRQASNAMQPTDPKPSPSADATSVPTPSPTPAPNAIPTPIPTAVPTPLPTAVPTPLPTAMPTPTPSPTPAPTLSLSAASIRQGDMLAFWLEDLPDVYRNDEILFRASWLNGLIPANEWEGRLVALAQATVSVSPNTYSVRAMYIPTDESGNTYPAEEIPGTRVLVQIEKRNFEQQIFSVSKELESTRSDANLATDREKVTKAKSNGSTLPLWEAAFLMPIEGGTAKAFGKQRIINGKLNYTHSGVDISATSGTPIHAPAAGRVAFAGELIVSGNTVILDHGLGMYSSLVHMTKTAAEVGQLVRAGDVVGYVGSTGFSTGPHLHWTLTVHGNIVDPEFLMKADPLAALREPSAP